jgi:hypothetical protein
MLIQGCAQTGRGYKIYIHDANRKLFIRDLKSNDVLTYKEGNGLICLPESDLKKVVDQLSTDKAYESKYKW